ncbi:MAG: hypothetical protein WD766_00940 [Gemmatimonadota bacterium]
MHDEPHHRVVHVDGDLKLLDVQVIPGDTTMAHTHSTPIFYTFVSTGSGPTNGRVSGVTRYAEEPFTHVVINDGPHLLRILALGNYGPPVRDGEDALPVGMPVEPQEENPWFRSYRLELGPGEETPLIRHDNPAVIIQATEGHTDVSRATGYGADLVKLGDWTWRDEGSPYRVRNAGSTPVVVVVNEGRRDD